MSLGFLTWKKEKALLLLARQVLDENQKEEVVRILKSEFDWKHFLDLLMKQQAVSIIAFNLEKISKEGHKLNIPIDIQMSIMLHREKRRQLKEAYSEEVNFLGKLFQQYGFKGVLLKGMALNLCFYTEDVRDNSDIDLLVEEKDAKEIFYLLKKTGYTPYVDKAEFNEDKVERIIQTHSCRFCDFVKKGDKFNYYLDLHIA